MTRASETFLGRVFQTYVEASDYCDKLNRSAVIVHCVIEDPIIGFTVVPLDTADVERMKRATKYKYRLQMIEFAKLALSPDEKFKRRGDTAESLKQEMYFLQGIIEKIIEFS